MPVTICLNMIVKNEASVIRRCLDSVRPIIDHWVIVDTGSTDGTQDIIREHLKDLPGELHERPWKDFAHNRSEALALARPLGGYSLIIDADDTLEIPSDFRLPELTADSYMLDFHDAGVCYQRIQIVRNTLPWRYRGVLHEYLACDDSQPPGHLGIVMRRNHDGARRRDPETYRKDAVILERALQTETDPFLIARYTFYLAQSRRDLGDKPNAIVAYLRRAELGYWVQEVFCSLYQAAKLNDELGHDRDEVIALYLRASDAAPGRAEALHGASRLCRLAGRNQQGYEIAQRGLALTAPVDGLFVEPWIYDYGLLDEYAVNAYWSGHYLDSLDACIKLLSNPTCPAEHRERFTANAKSALDKLPRMPERAAFTALRRPAGQHQLGPARELHALPPQGGTPKVLLAILAKQMETMLPLYLRCIEALDYPKSSIVIYIRTNNNKDRTREMLAEWVERVRPYYAAVEMDASDVPEQVETFGVHEWNAERFKVLGRIRNVSLRKTLEHGCAYYFTADVDNFIRPCTLKELVSLSLPIVAPLLRSVDETSRYSNYHADIDGNGYFRDCQQYDWILSQAITGVFELPVVHCTYLIRADVIPALDYEDHSGRHEYVIFSDRARRNGIPQYFDNRQLYGYLTLDEGLAVAEQAARLLAEDLDAARVDGPASAPLTAREGQEDRALEEFSAIYRNNAWGYGSGVGSLPDNNVRYIELVQSFLEKERVQSIVDFGCGDWQFSRFMDWKGATYVGLDLVPDLIETNRRAYGRPGVSFEVFSSLDDIPAADLLLCKDVFQHLPNDTIRKYLAAFKRKARFLLITNDDQPDEGLNSNIRAGEWRPVRLDYPPFAERAPILLSWMITAGGWKPTRKTTCLIDGRTD
jgi:glycosyltransferase involved in cell wall biosynthesis/SAM-dependent methyltransferase